MNDSVPGNRGLALPPADPQERVIRQQWERIWKEIAAVYSRGLPEPEVTRELDTSPPGSTAHNNPVLGHVQAKPSAEDFERVRRAIDRAWF